MPTLGRKPPAAGVPAPAAKLPSGENAIKSENRLPGSRDWRRGAKGSINSDDYHMQIQGYASATSVNIGDTINFHVTVNPAHEFTVAIYRLGYYGGDGARLVTTSPRLRGVRQRAPEVDESTGLISCRWPVAWSLDVPSDWTSGAYLAIFTASSGRRHITPFAVRDDRRRAELCVVLPFTTYQAYNQWPRDGKRGRSLYKGYQPRSSAAASPPPGIYERRAFKVSFDRPYADDGVPARFGLDHEFIRWIEHCGYDLAYASSVDLQAGRIGPAQYAGLIFSGHDEYWSQEMRDLAEKAVSRGTSLAFMASNNIYWHIRFEQSGDGRDNRVVVCYKTDTDPTPDASGPTKLWRDIKPDGSLGEQALVGVGLSGTMAEPYPLIVRESDHWFWAGCGLIDGDGIVKIVDAEADSFDPKLPGPLGVRQTLLSASPFTLRNGSHGTHNASVYETASGAVVFGSGTFNWPLALNSADYVDARIQEATANLLNRMCQRQQ